MSGKKTRSEAAEKAVKKPPLAERLGKEREEIFFYLYYFTALILMKLNTTMFGVSRTLVYSVLLPLSLVIFAKIIIYNYETKLRMLILLAVLALSVMISENSLYYYPLALTVLTVGASGVPFRKILKYNLIISAVIMAAAFAASMLGIIENLQYVTERGVRNSFGIVYPTDFAGHIFFIVVSLFVFLDKKSGYIHCLAGVIVSAVIYYFCRTRVDCACIIIFCAGAAVIKFCENKDLSGGVMRKIKEILRFVCTWSMPAAAVFMTALTLLYTPSSSLFSKLDNWLATRLSLGNRGLKEYGPTLFGQAVSMIGNGGSTQPKEDYFFVDCSYLYCYLRFGIIFTLVLIAAYVIIAMKYRSNGYMLFAIAVISLNCMISHHLPDCAYSVFSLALLADGGRPLSEVFGIKPEKAKPKGSF